MRTSPPLPAPKPGTEGNVDSIACSARSTSASTSVCQLCASAGSASQRTLAALSAFATRRVTASAARPRGRRGAGAPYRAAELVEQLALEPLRAERAVRRAQLLACLLLLRVVARRLGVARLAPGEPARDAAAVRDERERVRVELVAARGRRRARRAAIDGSARDDGRSPSNNNLSNETRSGAFKARRVLPLDGRLRRVGLVPRRSLVAMARRDDERYRHADARLARVAATAPHRPRAPEAEGEDSHDRETPPRVVRVTDQRLIPPMGARFPQWVLVSPQWVLVSPQCVLRSVLRHGPR